MTFMKILLSDGSKTYENFANGEKIIPEYDRFMWAGSLCCCGRKFFSALLKFFGNKNAAKILKNSKMIDAYDYKKLCFKAKKY